MVTEVSRQLTHGNGVGLLSPQAIGILTSAVVTVGIHQFVRATAAAERQPR
jgi:hypothetical protein